MTKLYSYLNNVPIIYNACYYTIDIIARKTWNVK